MLQENLFLYHRKPLAFSVLSIRSSPGGLRKGVQKKKKCPVLLSLHLPHPCFLWLGWCVYAVWGREGTQISPGCLEFAFSQPQTGQFQCLPQIGRETGKSWAPHWDGHLPSPPQHPSHLCKKTHFYKSTPGAQGRCPKCK